MRPRHVLIADDDRLLRDSLGDVMNSLGWQVSTAGSGADAIQVFERGALDLLLSDVDMPDMTGFQLLHWARTHAHAQPTVLMSARADDRLTGEAKRCGALDLLSKPLSFARLTQLVGTI